MRRWGIAALAATLVLGAGAGVAQAAPTWSVSDQSVTEGDSGTTQVTFTITASGLGALDTESIGYATHDGTATAPGDYTATSGTASVSSLLGGTASTTVTVGVNGDTTPERDETFRLVLDDGTSATATIVNDDAPHVTVSDPSVSEHDGNAIFTVSLDGAASVTVHYATADGTAAAGSDYGARSGTLTFSRTDAAKTVSVPIVDDTAPEATESFALQLSDASGVAAGANKLSGTATIADDDPSSPPPPPLTTTNIGSTPPAGTGLAPATSGSSTADTTPPQLTLSRPRSQRGSIVVAIACPATETLCRGTLTTFSEANRRSKVSQLRHERKLGVATFVIGGGKRASITTRLSKATLRLLRRAGKVSVRSYAVVRDASGNIGTASAGARLARVR